MKKYQFKTYQIADIGDYLKVFACTAVMAQPIMAMIMGIGQPTHTQDIFGIFYNLVKYTAPAFIFGILYTTIRTTWTRMRTACSSLVMSSTFTPVGNRS